MDRIEAIGLRRAPDLDLGAALPKSDPELLEKIRLEIADRGPMTFARFMEIALYDPGAGYYAARDRRAARSATGGPPGVASRGPGREGDFLTAPEAHPIFGWAIARRLERAWTELGRPGRFVVREHGAGRGALALGILDGLRRSDSALLRAIRYQPIEIAPEVAAALQRAIDAAGFASRIEEPDESLAPGAVIANELLDALPVHRVEGATAAGDAGEAHPATLLERFVVLDEDGADLTTVLGPPSTPQLATRLADEAVTLEPGQPAEICLAIDAWVEAATRSLERGLLLVIDYGAPASALYAPARGSTLRAYHRHRVHADPLVAIGRQDLTAHVDLTALEGAARRAGLRPILATTQGPYLADLGLGELLLSLQSGAGANLEAYLAARSAVVRMLDPRATGGFAVREFERDGMDRRGVAPATFLDRPNR